MSFSCIAEMKWKETSIHSELQILLCTMGTMCAKYAFVNPIFCLCKHVEVMRIVEDCDGYEFEVFLISFLCRISAQGFKNVSHLLYSQEFWKYSR